MNKFALLFTAAVLGAVPCMAGPDHLIPELAPVATGGPTQPDESTARFFTVFREGYGDDVALRAVVFPSFTSEYLVGVRATRNGDDAITRYSVVYLMPEIPLHAYESLRGAEGGLAAMDSNDPEQAEAYKRQAAYIAEWKARLPKDPKDIPVARCEKPLDSGVATKIARVWQDVLLETRYEPEGRMGFDGVTYHFYAHGKHQSLAGWTWSPDEGSKPALLAEMADLLADYCEGKAVAANLEKKAGDLAGKLQP